MDTAVRTPHTARIRAAARWLVTFAGFPLGGLAAMAVVGRVDDRPAAVVGGLLTGAVLGAAQSWGLRPQRISAPRWTLATTLGLAAGLGVGAELVGYSTDLGSLVTQGALCGAFVGAAQAVVLYPCLGSVALGWPAFLAAAWAAGWAVTTAGGVQVDEQFTVFGSFGAVTVAALTRVLPALIERRTSSAS